MSGLHRTAGSCIIIEVAQVGYAKGLGCRKQGLHFFYSPQRASSLPCAGIIGGNGSGKSTLFRMIMGQEQPDGGELVIGETVQLMYSEQSREGLDDARTVRQNPSCKHGWHAAPLKPTTLSRNPDPQHFPCAWHAPCQLACCCSAIPAWLEVCNPKICRESCWCAGCMSMGRDTHPLT